MRKATTRLPIWNAAVIASAVLAMSCGGHGVDTASTTQNVALVYRIDANGDLTAGIPVRLEALQLPRLAELKQREALEAVVANAGSEFERLLLLRDWAAAQWPTGTPDPYPPWDAITVLDWIRNGVTGGFCAQYSQVLLQSLASLGMQARYVEIGSTENPYAHFVVEVWSNQFNKWVMLDADYNLHFERNGVPLSALEVHDALVLSQLGDVDVISGTRHPGHSDPSLWPLQTAELYYYLRIHLKADHLATPQEPAFDRYNDMVEWLDNLTVPWELSQVDSPFPKVRLTNLQTDDRAAVENRLNQVKVTVESNDAGLLGVLFENNLHGFQGYEIRKLAGLGQDRPWQNHPVDTLVWRPSRDARILEVRGVNQAGVPGPVSRISVMLGAADR